MQNGTRTLGDAIQTAIDYEQKILKIYAQASDAASYPAGRTLYGALAEDERYHVAYLEKKLAQWQKTGVLTGEGSVNARKFALPRPKRVVRFPPPSTGKRTGARVVEWARLESACARNGTVGSNPTLSARSPNQLAGWGIWRSRLGRQPMRSAPRGSNAAVLCKDVFHPRSLRRRRLHFRMAGTEWRQSHLPGPWIASGEIQPTVASDANVE